MDARQKTAIRLSEDVRDGFARVAAKGSFNKPAFGGRDEGENPFAGKNPGVPTKRHIPADHEFNKSAVKPIVQTLWAASVALGHALTAHRSFSRLKSSMFSPDGLLGGRGYVLPVKDVRQNLFEACEQLSTICDTLHDEINAPHWKPKIAELEKSDLDEVVKLLGDADDWVDDPDGETEDARSEVEKEPLKRGDQERFEKEHDFGSKIPTGGDPETLPSQGPHPASDDHPANRRMKQASETYSYNRVANSSLAPQTEPGGPRVQHLDRGDTDQTGPGGSYNQGEKPVSDSWGETDGVSGEPMSDDSGDSYAYPAAWSGDFSSKGAASGVPDSNSESTPTQGWDFGIGDGNGNDAHGQGAGGYGEANPATGGYGVFGPSAEMPNDPGGKTKDKEESDSIPTIENSVSESGHMGLPVNAAAELPNDNEDPVARSDYYVGPKGNDFNGDVHAQAELPGGHTPQPDAMLGAGELPGDDSNVVTDYGLGAGPNLEDRVEHGDQPYIKWDDTTHNMRPDYNYQRGPIQGPYPQQA